MSGPLPEGTCATESKPLESDKVSASQTSLKLKYSSCFALMALSAVGTFTAEASKNGAGTYPYNTFVIPLTVEVIKLVSCMTAILVSWTTRDQFEFNFSASSFFRYSIPALCYFVTNNCMFYIIHDLGPATYQITSNLKIFSTALLMRTLLSHNLSWRQVKALILLVCGSLVTQIQSSAESSSDLARVHLIRGYFAVVVSSFSSSLGGVYSERLLKGKATGRQESILWQNCQLYFFGIFFGLISALASAQDYSYLYHGFNSAAYATIVALAACGLLVSYILKYLDNFTKCFVMAGTMLVVGVAHSLTSTNGLQLPLVLGIVITSIAVEQFNN